MYMQNNGYYHSKWVNEIILFHMHVCLFFFNIVRPETLAYLVLFLFIVKIYSLRTCCNLARQTTL